MVEYYTPILLSKKKLDAHNEEYAELRKLYEDTNMENNDLKKLLGKIQVQPTGVGTPPSGNHESMEEPLTAGGSTGKEKSLCELIP